MEERLIVAVFAPAPADAKMQHLLDAVHVAIDRRDRCTGVHGRELVANESSEQRRGRNAFAKDAGCQSEVVLVVTEPGSDLPVDAEG